MAIISAPDIGSSASQIDFAAGHSSGHSIPLVTAVLKHWQKPAHWQPSFDLLTRYLMRGKLCRRAALESLPAY